MDEETIKMFMSNYFWQGVCFGALALFAAEILLFVAFLFGLSTKAQ
jgi:hypothetical protein